MLLLLELNKIGLGLVPPIPETVSDVALLTFVSGGISEGVGEGCPALLPLVACFHRINLRGISYRRCWLSVTCFHRLALSL